MYKDINVAIYVKCTLSGFVLVQNYNLVVVYSYGGCKS